MGKAIVSLFSGCGGLDLGFCQADFDVIWANEYDRDIWQTYENNHPDTLLDKRDIREISSAEIPDCVGIIGGPPCQSWSEAGTQRGIDDDRGRLFLEYVRILKDKQPLFFLAENVSGMLHKKHRLALSNIIAAFEEAGYVISWKLLNAKHYHVDLGKRFNFDYLKPEPYIPTLRDVIWDLRESAIPALGNNKTKMEACLFPNHEYMTGGFSSIYMSRNRVRDWDEPSFTIQAGGRHAPIHPQANKMLHVGKDTWIFDPNSLNSYRRLSIRECLRIQTFPDSFIFYYQNLASAYKMIGNAVPVNLSYAVARAIYEDLFNYRQEVRDNKEEKRSTTSIELSLVSS